MSMSIDIGEDAGELEEDDLDVDRDDDDDDDGDDRSTRGSGRRRQKATSTDDEDDPDDEDDADDLTPEELRAELKKVRAMLARTGKQTARQRTARRAAEKRLRELEGASDDDEDESDDEGDDKPKAPTAKSIQKTVSRAVRERERQLEEAHRRDLINTRAETALTRAGVSDRNVRLLLKEIDAEEIDFDPKTRSIDGLVEEIDRLRDEFPDLFRRRRDSRRRINGGDERDGRSKPKRPMTTTEIQAAQLRGR